MTGLRKVVIILDVNAIPRASKRRNSQDETEEEGTSELNEYDRKAIAAVKDSVLLLLCKEAMKSNSSKEFRKFDFSRVEWAFKLFNSSVEIHSKTGKKFSPLNSASLENFEASLDAVVQADSASAVKSVPEANNIKLLSTALMNVLSDLRWLEAASSESGKSSGNSIHAFLRVPRNDREFDVFTSNCSVVFQPKDVLHELIPRAFLKKMRDDCIQLNFVDMWNLHVNSGILSETESWDGIHYEKSMRKIAQALFHGTVAPLYHTTEKPSNGLPSYSSLLKLVMVCDPRSPKPKASNDSSKALNSSFENKINTSANQGPGSSNISPEFDSGSRKSTFAQRLEVSRSRNSLNKLRESHLDSNPFESRALLEGQIRKKKPPHRYSDDCMLLSKQASRKRKLYDDYDDDHEDYDDEDHQYVRVPSGYSKRDINLWHDQGRENLTYRDHKHHRLALMSKYAMQEERALGRVRERRYAIESFPDKYSPELCDAFMMRKFKRSRKQDEESLMAPPSRSKSIKTLRHSAPNSFPEPRLSTSFSGSKVSPSLATSRGKMMLAEGIRKTAVSKNQEVGIAGNSESIDNQELLQKQHQLKLKERQNEFNSLKTRFELKLSEIQTEEFENEDLFGLLDSKVNRFREVSMANGTNLLCLAQVLVSILTKALGEWKVKDTPTVLESILLISADKLNWDILRTRNKDSDLQEDTFSQLELQVLLNLEIALCISEDVNNKRQELLEETIKLLQLIRMYRKDPPIEEFVNETLLPEYQKTLPGFLNEILFSLNILPPEEMQIFSPGPKGFRDDCSVSSVSSSIMSSVSIRYERERLSQESLSKSYLNASQDSHSHRTLKKGFSFLQANNPKRAIMVPTSKPKDKKSRTDVSRVSASRSSAVPRPSPKPKKVRRNLFDVSAADSKDMKNLVSLATNSNSFTRSPSLFKSPSVSSKKSAFSPKSPCRISPYFRAARSRSRKCLNLEAESNNSNSCEQSPGISAIVPESPYTPQSKGGTSNSGSGALSSKSVIQESPEIDKSCDYSNSHPLSRRVNSVSFYSSRTDLSKAKAWEISGNKLTAARIKDSVDASMGLNLSDLEILPSYTFSPNLKIKFQRSGTEADSSTDIANHDSAVVKEKCSTTSPIASSSSTANNFAVGTSNTNHVEIVNAKPGELQSTTIEALINCENFPPASVILNAGSTTFPGPTSPTKHLPVTDTPKKVVFNLQENLINTPSPKNHITGTPKSILKDTSTSGLVDYLHEGPAQ